MPVASSGPAVSRGNQQPVFLAQGNGVIYIKIARKDLDGNDNTLSLQELNNLRIKFSDYGIADYPIVNITEYPDYYLYQIPRVNITSSADNNIRNYSFSASIPSLFVKTVLPSELADLTAHYVVNTDVLNYFNTGIYTFGDTPNVKINYNISAEFSNTSGTQAIAFYLTPISGSSIASATANISGANQIVSFSGTASFIENSSYILRVLNDSPSNIQVTSINWAFTQSITPQSSSNLTVLEPYLVENFNYSDCDVLMNNVDENQIGSFFRRVLYDDGSIIPSNFQQILSQSAEYAEVKDYNYTARAQILPRYDGVRTTSPDFNLNTITIGQYEGTRLNSLRTGDPNVQSLGTYFAYFDWLGGTTPELIGKASAHILYLIGSDGTVQNPDISGLYYYNLIDSFEAGKKANIILNAISGNPQTIGNIPIIAGGAIPMPILASQTGSDITPYPTISFYNPTTSPPDYVSLFSTNAQNIGPNNWIELDLNTNIGVLPSTIIQTGNYIEINANSTTNLTNIAIQAALELYFDDNNVFQSIPSRVYVALEESTDNGTNWNLIGGDNFLINDNQSLTYTVTSNYVTPIQGNLYRCRVYSETIQSGVLTIGGPNGTTLGVIQNIPATNAYVTSGSGQEYFTTGSSSKNILTGSQFTLAVYNQQQPLTQYSPFSGSGYFSFLPFSLKVGDQIRFEGDENQVYTIIDVNVQFHSIPFNLVLDRNIVDGTNINSFLIRRFDLNPNFITLDTNLASYQGGGGFILPQYTTNELQANFDRIIKDLKEKGLIS